MTHEQVAEFFPGADKVPDTGLVDIPIEGKPGVVRLKFWFQNDRRTMKPAFLSSVTLVLDPALTNAPGFWDTLWRVCEKKFGKIRKREKIEKQFITWSSPTLRIEQLRIAQLSKFPVKEGMAFHLAIHFEQGSPPGAATKPAGRRRR